jgi:signal transduction histidine kinase
MARSLRIRAVLVVLAVALWPLLVGGWAAEALWQVLPVALVLAWWLGWRMVRPVELLRDQVLARLDGSVQGGIALGRSDEFGELATAFDIVLRRLEDRNQANLGFAADLAHELKSPLAALRAAGEALEDAHLDPGRAARLGRLVIASTARLDSLACELLDLARAETGMAGEPREALDVAALARALLETCRSDERWQGCDFRYEGPTTLTISAVPGRIETALRNLLINAASFAGHDGHVAVVVQRTEDSVVVAVRDDGPGIAATELPRIFDRFFTTRAGSGSGLGLALAEAHGGTVDVQSTLGEGATFTVRLPVA